MSCCVSVDPHLPLLMSSCLPTLVPVSRWPSTWWRLGRLGRIVSCWNCSHCVSLCLSVQCGHPAAKDNTTTPMFIRGSHRGHICHEETIKNCLLDYCNSERQQVRPKFPRTCCISVHVMRGLGGRLSWLLFTQINVSRGRSHKVNTITHNVTLHPYIRAAMTLGRHKQPSQAGSAACPGVTIPLDLIATFSFSTPVNPIDHVTYM